VYRHFKIQLLLPEHQQWLLRDQSLLQQLLYKTGIFQRFLKTRRSWPNRFKNFAKSRLPIRCSEFQLYVLYEAHVYINGWKPYIDVNWTFQLNRNIKLASHWCWDGQGVADSGWCAVDAGWSICDYTFERVVFTSMESKEYHAGHSLHSAEAGLCFCANY